MVEYLVSHGLPARLQSHGYGETLAVDKRHDERAWAKNRRVEFISIDRTGSWRAQSGGTEVCNVATVSEKKSRGVRLISSGGVGSGLEIDDAARNAGRGCSLDAESVNSGCRGHREGRDGGTCFAGPRAWLIQQGDCHDARRRHS